MIARAPMKFMSTKARHRVRNLGGLLARIGLWALVWVGLTLLFASIGIRLFFGKISIDQLVFNLIALHADGGSATVLVWLGVVVIGVLPIAITTALGVWRAKLARRHHAARAAWSPRLRRTVKVGATLIAAGVIMLGTSAYASTVKLTDYIEAGEITADMGDYYATPTTTEDSNSRNIVVVYLESGEETLSDDGIFAGDMLAPIEEATAGWASIEGYRQYTGGGWTMAGIVSTQCGVPLKGKIATGGSEVIHEFADGMDSFLPGVDCFGDVLADYGYHNVFLGGAETTFAAKNVFLADHGYTTEKGRADWEAAGEAEKNFRSDWGLSDNRLMAHAKTEITALHDESEQTGQPFNLTLLTLDTHEPAHAYDYCPVTTEAEMASVYACSMTQVAGFIDYMRDQGYLEDTAVVVMGDHLKQLGGARAFHDDLTDRTDRTIFNRVWIPGGTTAPDLRKGADQLSMYPTLLEAAGLTVQDHRAALGVSAFTSTLPEGSAPALTRAAYRELLKSRSSEFYKGAWK